jgi:hypothetical protein
MQSPLPPSFCFTCADARASLRVLHGRFATDRGVPGEIYVDDAPWRDAPDLETMLGSAQRVLNLRWASNGGGLGYDARGLVRCHWPDAKFSIAEFRTLLQHLPFRWMSAATMSSVWGPGGQPHDYLGPGFGEGHYDHGWACAFKGDGHDQLVSRRWLDYGPWRLIRGDNDVSLVQFHDLEADDLVALEQAKPGHQCMGISPEGGFIEPLPFPWKFPDLRKLYDPGARVLTVVVHGRTVSGREMLEACALRRYQALEVPVDNVAFVFLEERAAREHLHALWLRGLECRAIIAGREVRLDQDYEAPPPVEPEWVQRVRDRDGF